MCYKPLNMHLNFWVYSVFDNIKKKIKIFFSPTQNLWRPTRYMPLIAMFLKPQENTAKDTH